MTRSKLPFRPRASVLALEPRVLFDGAGAIAAVDHLADASAPAERAKEVPAGQTPTAAWGNSHTERWALEATGPEAAGPTLLLVVDARVADQASLLAGRPANAV